MDKRLNKLLKSGVSLTDGCMLDTYNQSVQEDCSCTIRTNINTANHHFLVVQDKNIEPIGCAMRGRNPENPSERKQSNGKYKQRIEMGSNISNAITSVQKDSLVAESIIIDDYNQRVPQDQDVIGTVTTQFGNIAPRHGYKIAEPSYRIRKLTPRECFRLMGVTESDIDKIQKSGVSNSQQYKMAGNSIVVDVMYYIFKNMFANETAKRVCSDGQLQLF